MSLYTPGRRTATVPWSSRYRRVFDYWNNMDSDTEDEMEIEIEVEKPEKPNVDEKEKEKEKPKVDEKEKEKEQPKPDPTILKVVNVNLNTNDNSVPHHTSEYDVIETKKCLVVRRGQAFDLDIEFNRVYDEAKDDLRIVFEFGKSPIASRNTQVEFILSAKDVKKEWGAFIESTTGNSIKMRVTSPPDCYVGKWMLKVEAVKAGEEEILVHRYNHRNPIYIIFNPWCKDDAVYMHDRELLKEYVLNDNGAIYVGSYDSISAKSWFFGQFESVVLDCALYLLDERSGMPPHVRGNPIAISRKLSALINSPDDRGILAGNWSGEYEGGIPPLTWTGSVAILKEFYKTKQPVKYGQCWVFSGLFTTVCRTLGIPIRSVTNFASAHDTDGTIRIDRHYDMEEKPIEGADSDSIWNFHVWNDAWMSRPDLPPGYGGWQAVDATPQETSEGVYCMGPMPLRAIKNGEVFYPYDGKFVFAEVNADICNWQLQKDGSVKLLTLRKGAVGKNISTKEALGSRCEDVTDQYKFEEGSKEERASIYRANLHSSMPDFYEDKMGLEDVNFELVFNKDTFMGDKVAIDLVITNNSDDMRYLDGTLLVSSIYYTGVHHKDISEGKMRHKLLLAGKKETVTLIVEESNYLELLMDHCILGISGLFCVHPTNQYFPVQEQLRLRKPHLDVKGPVTGKKGQTIAVEVSFTNPLSVALTECELRVEGSGLTEPMLLKYGDVKSKEKFTGKFEVTPKKFGKKTFSMAFNSKQIRSVNASYEVVVE